MPFKIFGRFVELTVVSVAVGVVIGFLSALSYKKIRIITMNPIMECVILFCLLFVGGFRMLRYYLIINMWCDHGPLYLVQPFAII